MPEDGRGRAKHVARSVRFKKKLAAIYNNYTNLSQRNGMNAIKIVTFIGSFVLRHVTQSK